jgi:hypothetical protein
MMRIQKALALLLVAWGPVRGFAAPTEKPAPIRGQGCVSAGVEAHCLVVRDLKSGKLYNLIFKDIQPAIGEGIEFEALPHEGAASCLQGTALDVTAWTRKDTLRCKPRAAPKKQVQTD